MIDFTYTDAQLNKIKAVVRARLARDADQIELTRPADKLEKLAAKIAGTDDNPTTTTSLRSCIETAASLHVEDSAIASQTPGHKARIKQLDRMRKRTTALRDDIIDTLRPGFTSGRGTKQLRRGSDPISVHSTGRAIETLLSVIDASIAAQRPQQTANTSKTGRDRFCNEMLSIWISIGGGETGTPAAEFLVATSKPVFDKLRAIGAPKTTFSAVDKVLVVEWLRVRAKTRQAAPPETSVFRSLRLLGRHGNICI